MSGAISGRGDEQTRNLESFVTFGLGGFSDDDRGWWASQWKIYIVWVSTARLSPDFYGMKGCSVLCILASLFKTTTFFTVKMFA